MKEGIQGLAVGRKDILRIHPSDLHIRDEWNCRDVNFDPADPDDLALAESIAAVGVKQPLTAVWENGKAWLTDGHRRHAAALHAINVLGAEIKSVPVQTEDRYASEAERVLSQLVRNNGKALTPIEAARVYKRLIDLGWSEKQIAESIGRSVNWVKGLLELQAAPSAVTAMVRSGAVSATLAMETIRKTGDGEKAAAALGAAVQKAAAAGKSKATAKHVEKVAYTGIPKSGVTVLPAGSLHPDQGRKAAAFDKLKRLCGYVENGSDTTVKVFQDDATREWFVRVGKAPMDKVSFGPSLLAAIEAVEEESEEDDGA